MGTVVVKPMSSSSIIRDKGALEAISISLSFKIKEFSCNGPAPKYLFIFGCHSRPVMLFVSSTKLHAIFWIKDMDRGSSSNKMVWLN